MNLNLPALDFGAYGVFDANESRAPYSSADGLDSPFSQRRSVLSPNFPMPRASAKSFCVSPNPSRFSLIAVEGYPSASAGALRPFSAFRPGLKAPPAKSSQNRPSPNGREPNSRPHRRIPPRA